MPLPPRALATVKAAIETARSQCNEEMAKSWYLIRNNPDAYRNQRKGVEIALARLLVLLTEPPK